MAVLLPQGFAWAADPPMVALVYSKWRQGNDMGWGDVLTSLGWPIHHWQNVHIQRLVANLDRYDMVLMFNGSNTVNLRDFSAYREQWLAFMKRGGVIFALGIQESMGNWDWIANLGSDFSFDLRTFRGFQRTSDWMNPMAQLNLGRLEAKWAEFSHWSDKWIVTNRNGNNQPIAIYQKVGNGLIVVSTSYGGEFSCRAKILKRVGRFARESAGASSLGIKDASWPRSRFGRNEVDLTVQNTSGSTIDFEIMSTTFTDEGVGATDAVQVRIESGTEKTLTIPYRLGDGPNNVSLVLKDVKGPHTYARTGKYFKLLDLRGAMNALDEQITTVKATLDELNTWPKQVLESAWREYGRFLTTSANLKPQLQTESRDLRLACHESIMEATGKVKILAAKAETWQNLHLTPGTSQKFAVTASVTLRKVFRDRAHKSPVASELHLKLAANEYESIQIVIVPLAGELRDVRVSCSALRSSGAIIEDVRIRHVADVYFPLAGDEAGWYPDVLLPSTSFDVSADHVAKTVWLTVHTNPNAAAGTYSATVTVRATDSVKVELPLTVRVWNFAVPHKRNLPTQFSLRPNQLARFYFGEKAYKQFPKYLPAATYRQFLEYLLKYRIAPYAYSDGAAESQSHLGYLGEKRVGNKVTELDFTEYDKIVQLMLDHGVELVCAGILFSPSEEYYKSFLPKIYEHFREKGWHEQAFVYGWDEFRPEKLPEIRQNYAWIKETAPQFKHLIPYNEPDNTPAADDPGYMDIWVPSLSLYTKQLAAERARYGQSVWAYVVNHFDIRKSMNDYRSLFEEIWRRRCAGFLYFCTAFLHWAPSTKDLNPNGLPTETFIRKGTGAIDGIYHLCYPAGHRPEDGLNASLRLEAIRDGLEDWEYFNLLSNLIEHRHANESPQVRAASRLLQQIDDGTADGDLLARRQAVAKMIESLTVE